MAKALDGQPRTIPELLAELNRAADTYPAAVRISITRDQIQQAVTR